MAHQVLPNVKIRARKQDFRLQNFPWILVHNSTPEKAGSMIWPCRAYAGKDGAAYLSRDRDDVVRPVGAEPVWFEPRFDSRGNAIGSSSVAYLGSPFLACRQSGLARFRPRAGL